jgi:hypothetical protein
MKEYLARRLAQPATPEPLTLHDVGKWHALKHYDPRPVIDGWQAWALVLAAGVIGFALGLAVRL